jgi:uncharacterized protein (DUF433 family)
VVVRAETGEWKLLSLILGYLASGSLPDEIIGEFPDLTAEDISACLVYAWDLSDVDVAA